MGFKSLVQSAVDDAKFAKDNSEINLSLGQSITLIPAKEETQPMIDIHTVQS